MTLLGLIEAVERGDEAAMNDACREIWRADIDVGKMPWIEPNDIRKAFSGSLDAAKRLHDALLPGWAWEICSDDAPDAAIVWNHAKLGRQFSGKRGDDGNVARAWLLAVLKALENQHEK